MTTLDEYAQAAAGTQPWGSIAVVIRTGDSEHTITATDMAKDILTWAIGIGLMPDPTDQQRPPTPQEVEEMARWLAAASQHPRFSERGHGWQGVLTTTHMLDMAAAEARHHAPDQDTRARIDATHAALRTYGVRR